MDELSSRDVEKLTGVSKATVSRIRNGQDFLVSVAKRLLPALDTCPVCHDAQRRELAMDAVSLLSERDARAPVAPAVKVNPLVWDRIDQVTEGSTSTLGNRYTVWSIDGSGYCKFPNTAAGERFTGGIKEAKAAAQSHHEAAVLSAIEPTQDATDARNEALREAAECCTKELRNTTLLMSNPPQSSAAWEARNAIRALIKETDT